MKNQNKPSVAKDMAPSEIHGLLIGSPGPGPMYRLNPPLISTVCINKAGQALKTYICLRVVGRCINIYIQCIYRLEASSQTIQLIHLLKATVLFLPSVLGILAINQNGSQSLTRIYCPLHFLV